MNQKGFAQILFLLTLLAGIGIAVYLIQFTQIFRPKASSTQTEFYVSPSGLDSNNGTINSPFRTLEKAKFAVRAVNKSMSAGITVWLRNGIHELSSPYVLEPDDSGFNGHHVVYRGYPGEIAIISGGKKVTGWVQEGDKWKASSGGINTRQLYVNGKKAVRARTEGGLPGAQVLSSGFGTSDLSFQNFRNKEDMEIVLNNFWLHFRCRVLGISGGTISLTQLCFNQTQALSTIQVPPVVPNWIENAFELLDQPGEWYLDKGSQTIYYKPRPGETLSNAYMVAPVLENLISVKGTPGNPVSNLNFENLRFEYTTWNEPSTDGYIGGGILFSRGALSTNINRIPPAVLFESVKNTTVKNNIFARLGGVGIDLPLSNQDNSIVGNHFADISADAVGLGDFEPSRNDPQTPANQLTRGNIISNNYIHDIATEYSGSGIWVGYAQDTVISNNELAHLPYIGIGVNTFPAHWDLSTAKNNKILNNLVYDHMRVGIDGAGIYVNSNQQPGSEISGNVIHDQHHRFGNIYLDDGATGWKVTWNLIYNILTSDLQELASGQQNVGRGLSAKGCSHTIEGNFLQISRSNDFQLYPFYSNGQDCSASNKIAGNATIAQLSQVPQSLIEGAGLQSEYRSIKLTDLNPLFMSSITVSPPANWNPGEAKQFPVTITNSGFQIWNKAGADQVNLAVYIGPDDHFANASPYQALVPLTSDLSPGQSQTLTAAISAPQTPGNYVLRMRMVKQGAAWFDLVSKTNIIVSATPQSPSPSPLKPGDTDNDGDVDIFDYNLILTEFGKKNDPNTKADLDNDDDVDIFDYNIILTNFGR